MDSPQQGTPAGEKKTRGMRWGQEEEKGHSEAIYFAHRKTLHFIIHQVLRSTWDFLSPSASASFSIMAAYSSTDSDDEVTMTQPFASA